MTNKKANIPIPRVIYLIIALLFISVPSYSQYTHASKNQTKTSSNTIKTESNSAINYQHNIIQHLSLYPFTADKTFFIGIYIGLLLVILLLSTTFYYNNKQKVYLYYALFIFTHTLFAIMVYKNAALVIDSTNYRIHLFIQDLFGGLHWLAYLVFISNFIRTKDYFPIVHVYLKKLLVILIGVTFVNSILLIIITDLPSYMLFRNISLLVLFLINLAMFVRFIISNNTYAKIISIGGFALSLSWLLFIVGLICNENLIYIFQAGQTIEIVVFTYGISFLLRQKEKSRVKSQKQLIRQLRKNRQIQDSITEELEEKVQNRTLEIELKNKELQTRNEEVTTQRDQIEVQKQEILQQNNDMEEQTNLFLEQNAEISASIHYTRRLQSAMLTSQEEIDRILPNSFIFFLPRNIVSGDFYWIQQVHHYTIVAAGDSTGHGVPGAFISLLGISALNEIVLQREFTNPSLILGEMREHIKRTLRQTGKQEEANDGIDIALCVIDPINKLIDFAGAYNPLVLIREGNLVQLKGDRMPVGIHYNEKPVFTTKTVSYEIGDCLYLFSDGFADQIGGPREKKFKTNNFKKLLLEIHQQPMPEQKELLYQTYMGWKNNYDQIDDILIIGLQL